MSERALLRKTNPAVTGRRRDALLGAGVLVFVLGGAVFFDEMSIGFAALAGVFGLAALAAIFVSGRRGARARTNAADAEVAQVALPQSMVRLIDRLPDPLLVLDEAGRILGSNKSVHSVLSGAADRRHVSVAVRAPGVLEAVELVLAGGHLKPLSTRMSGRSSGTFLPMSRPSTGW